MKTVVAGRAVMPRCWRSLAVVSSVFALAGSLPTEVRAQSTRPQNGPPSAMKAVESPADKVVNSVRFDQMLDTPMPRELTFRDETGKTVKLGDFYGKKPVVTALIFYNCTMLCNQVLNQAMLGFKDLKYDAGKDFEVVIVSIDPSEGPELALGKKKNYIKEYGRKGTENGWHFLVADKKGDDTNIKKLANAIGYHYTPDPNIGFAHPAGLVISTPEGRIARYLLNFPYDARDLKYGLLEAGNNKIGSFVDQIAMLCFHYDSTMGKYTLSIMKVVRLAFALTVVLMGIFLVVMVRRDQKHHAHWKADGTPADSPKVATPSAAAPKV